MIQALANVFIYSKINEMKFTFLLWLVFAINTYASGYSQTITLSARAISLENVFAAIKQQTGYSVFYNKKLMDQAKTVTVEARNMPLNDFLRQALIKQPLNFRIDEKTIILSEKPV